MVVSTHGCWEITAQSPCYTSSAVAVAAVAAAALRKPLFFPSFVPPATLSVCLCVDAKREGGFSCDANGWMLYGQTHMRFLNISFISDTHASQSCCT